MARHVLEFGRLCAAAALGGALIVMIANPAPVSAASCTASSVIATGKPGYFQFTAAGQARKAWMHKVERDPRLGTPYARWAVARDAKVTCRQIASRYRCIAVADPCRNGDVSTADTNHRGPA